MLVLLSSMAMNETLACNHAGPPIYRGFLTDRSEAISLARKFPHRIRKQYEIYLSDDLTAEHFGRECIDLSRAIEKMRESVQ